MLRVNFFLDPYCFVAFLYGEILGSEKRNGTNWPIRTSNAFEVGSQNDLIWRWGHERHNATRIISVVRLMQR